MSIENQVKRAKMNDNNYKTSCFLRQFLAKTPDRTISASTSVVISDVSFVRNQI